MKYLGQVDFFLGTQPPGAGTHLNEMPGPHDDLKVEVSQCVSYFQCWLGYLNHDSKKKKKDVSFLDKENTRSSLQRLTFLGCRASPSLQTKQKGLALGCMRAQVCLT